MSEPPPREPLAWLAAYAAPIEGDRLDGAIGAIELGVGKTLAAVSLTERLAAGPVAGVLLFGVCGVYRTGAADALDVGDLCVVGDDQLADEGVATEGGFRSIDALGFGSVGPFAADPEHSARVAAILGDVPVVRGATVSTCSGVDALAAEISSRTGARVESMEGAAVGLVCRRFDVPWIQVRCVSNRCGRREDGRFDIRGASDRVQGLVGSILDALR